MRKRIRGLVAGTLYRLRVHRLWWLVQTRVRRRNVICVLGLHRVLSDADRQRSHSQDTIVLRERTFAKLLEFLKGYYDVIPVSHLPSIPVTSGNPLCVMTFDDGWSDNYHQALPHLRNYQIPSVLLAATGFIGTNETFWVERLKAALAGTRGSEIRNAIAVRAGQSTPGDDEAVLEYLKHMPAAERNAILQPLLADDDTTVSTADRMMTWDQMRSMSREGVEIGGHTVTHPLLTNESDEAIRQEVLGCKASIEREIGAPVRSFAYPNGDFDARVRQAVVDAGYSCAFTTCNGWYADGDDPYTIPRCLLHEDNVTGADGEFSPAMFELTIAGWR